MNVNVRFSGAVEKIIDEAVKKGYAATKTEVLRLGVFELNNRFHLLRKMEDEEDIARADAIMERIARGEEKLYPESEVMGKIKGSAEVKRNEIRKRKKLHV